MVEKLIQKSIRFPQKTVELLDKKAKESFGIDFNDYVKFLVLQEANKLKEEEFVISLDAQTIKDIKEARILSKQNKLKILKSHKEIDKFIDAIDNG